jgi:hypothetical protein
MAALRLAPVIANELFQPNQTVATLLNEIFDAGGVAWLPLAKASRLLTRLPSKQDSNISEQAWETLKNHFENRISLGDRTVEQLLGTRRLPSGGRRWRSAKSVNWTN